MLSAQRRRYSPTWSPGENHEHGESHGNKTECYRDEHGPDGEPTASVGVKNREAHRGREEQEPEGEQGHRA